MSYAKEQRQRRKGQDFPGGFFSFPYIVLDTEKYKSLSYSAKCLLVEFGRQINGSNNGNLQATFSYLKGKRGFGSKATLARAIEELKRKQLICETRKGYKGKCSLYGLTWLTFNYDPKEHDIDPMDFPRGGYRDNFVDDNDTENTVNDNEE